MSLSASNSSHQAAITADRDQFACQGGNLRETGALEEAEALFRELVTARQQVLEPNDFGIGRALGGLAKTLEEASKLDEARVYAQQALVHRLDHEGPDAWWTNRKRLDLARVVSRLGRSVEAMQLLDALQASITSNAEPDDDERVIRARVRRDRHRKKRIWCSAFPGLECLHFLHSRG
ncbi:MAG: tetratricopeptide repeat protein [Cyanobacteriota bacterium]|nr:tetratricopeptide repeat protein [Cyanobacteriota bacterium]